MKVSETKQTLLKTALDLIWEHSYGSVSVDDICRRAGVLKGSFYHFFPSKSDLTVAAIEEYWAGRQIKLDQAFSARHDPIQRLMNYCDQVNENQKARFSSMKKVGGCPFSAVGSELSTQDEKVRKKIEQIGLGIRTYIESALRDAAREGLTPTKGISERAAQFYAFLTGTLMQARIANDLGRLDSIKPAMIRLLTLDVRQPA